MRFNTLLSQRCTLIHENQKVGEDDYGQDIFDSVEVNGVPCRLDNLNQYQSPGATGTDYLTNYVLFLGKETDVSLSMTIQDIKDKDGYVVLAGSFKVEQINPKFDLKGLHHYELRLSEG